MSMARSNTATTTHRSLPNWLVLLSCCGCAAGSIGICLNAVGVFYTPVTHELGFSRGAFALHATISSVMTGLLSPAAAFLFQRWSTRVLMTTGILLAVVSTAAMSMADTLWLFYVLGFLRGTGCTLFAFTPLTMIIGHWFRRRHGFAIGLVFSFSGIAGATFSPWFSYLIAQFGWRNTFLVMAICLAVVSLPGGLLLRMKPYGEAEEPVIQADSSDADRQKTGSEGFPVFSIHFMLTGLFIMLLVSITGVAQHFPGYAESIGRTAQFGATMLSAAMIGNIVFKLIIGLLSDWMGPVKACMTMGTINVAGLLLLLLAGRITGTAGLYLFAFLYGAIYSLGAVGTPLFIRHLYGKEHYASAFGYAGALASISGAVALTTIGYLYDWTGSYQIALFVATASGIVGLILLQVVHRMHPAGWHRTAIDSAVGGNMQDLLPLSDEMFALLTRYANQSDNNEDNLRRAEVLGYGGRNVRIAPGAIVRVDPKRIGSNIFIGLYCYLNGPVTIGDNVLIGPHCSITAGHHRFDPATGWFSARTDTGSDDSILIGEGSWLASGVTVTAGVKVGKANLVCAHAVVTKDTSDYAIMAGVPARQAGHIDPVTGAYHWYREKPSGIPADTSGQEVAR